MKKAEFHVIYKRNGREFAALFATRKEADRRIALLKGVAGVTDVRVAKCYPYVQLKGLESLLTDCLARAMEAHEA